MHDQPFEQLVTDYEPLLKSCIQKLNLYRDYEEYYQIGMIALWTAYCQFDPEKGAFPAYAQKVVRGHMLMFMKKEQHFSERHLLHDDDTTYRLADNDAEEAFEAVTAPLEEYLHPLSARERLWVLETFVQQKKLGQIATEQGVSPNTVASWRKQALKKLRDRFKPLHREAGADGM
ncbi:sigma-70 family RNA polymerase sigma factor [Alkalihalobacillus oceani]|uniref:Sigma-70 family RNA polymerase sigma factor n=1 Tax=Halalkalibacter oceani TaxID=1653776 RepID=A0A9X2DSG8_9BACI|nr:sigma-70 family RNA polymerase sigma factor [Halalkalibacter oceani]MCM3715637.1 sigma-70 family RNA polymerase sigma factor [Halalkalibacter oceani]